MLVQSINSCQVVELRSPSRATLPTVSSTLSNPKLTRSSKMMKPKTRSIRMAMSEPDPKSGRKVMTQCFNNNCHQSTQFWMNLKHNLRHINLPTLIRKVPFSKWLREINSIRDLKWPKKTGSTLYMNPRWLKLGKSPFVWCASTLRQQSRSYRGSTSTFVRRVNLNAAFLTIDWPIRSTDSQPCLLGSMKT